MSKDTSNIPVPPNAQTKIVKFVNRKFEITINKFKAKNLKLIFYITIICLMLLIKLTYASQTNITTSVFLSSGLKPVDTCYLEDKKNEYTGERTVSYITGGDGYSYVISKINKGPVSIYIQLESETPYIIPNGTIFYIRFMDSTILKLPTYSADVYDYSALKGKFSNSFNFTPTPAQLQMLKGKYIYGFKYYLSECKLNDDDSKEFSKGLKCVIFRK